jgi:hypothetical protein
MTSHHDPTDISAPDPASSDEGRLPPMVEAELAILTHLSSVEAVRAFEAMRTQLRPDTAPQFTQLLEMINAFSGPDFAEKASAELVDAVTSTGEVRLFDRYGGDIDDPIGALALAQVIRLVAANRPILGDTFGL